MLHRPYVVANFQRVLSLPVRFETRASDFQQDELLGRAERSLDSTREDGFAMEERRFDKVRIDEPGRRTRKPPDRVFSFPKKPDRWRLQSKRVRQR